MTEYHERESMDFDVVVVGGGPSGLATACRLMQLAKEKNSELSIVVVEKGSEIGAHILSGNVFETSGLDELFPDWKTQDAPLKTPVSKDILLSQLYRPPVSLNLSQHLKEIYPK